MISLRIMAKPSDAEEIIERLKNEFSVISVSGPYNCRNDIRVRYYVNVDVGQTSDCESVTAQTLAQAYNESKAEGLI